MTLDVNRITNITRNCIKMKSTSYRHCMPIIVCYLNVIVAELLQCMLCSSTTKMVLLCHCSIIMRSQASETSRYLRAGVKVIYHPLYGINNFVLIWGDWLSCDPLRGSHDSQSPQIRKHLCPILWQL